MNMEATTYSAQGKVTGSITLPESVFGVRWNSDLVHQVVTSMQANVRQPLAHTKGSGDVRGGGKKPWQQKGTGRARHGSRRSPLWRGGGVTHGPRNDKVYARRINKKMRVKALYAVLSRKLSDGEVIFVDELTFAAPKTAQAVGVLAALAQAGFPALVKKKHHAALLALPAEHAATVKSFRNLKSVTTHPLRALNPVLALAHKYVILVNPHEAVTALVSRMGASAPEVATPSTPSVRKKRTKKVAKVS